MICEFCGKHFLISHKGSGGKNRTTCYDCLPEGLTGSERKYIRTRLIDDYITKLKTGQRCSTCGYNKCANAL